MAPRVPAAIRYNNPGAMWGNALARKWGALPKAVVLNDGLGQGNNIAVFPDKVHGAAAQFDLWRTRYTGVTLAAAIKRWSGGNWSQPYAQYLTKHTGIQMDELITVALLRSDRGWKLMKYQASWEAGRAETGYPMSDAEWIQAQHMVFDRVTTDKVKQVVVKGGLASGGLAETVNHVTQTYDINEYVLYSLAVIAAIGIIYWVYRSVKNV